MYEKMQDLFKNPLERDVYNKAEEDISAAFTRVIVNFASANTGGIGLKVAFPAIVALAWVLRSALLSVRSMKDKELYEEMCEVVQAIITSNE